MEPKGVKVADNEKAYLDMLYYYLKGTRFLFDPLIKVRTEKLNLKKSITTLNHKIVATLERDAIRDLYNLSQWEAMGSFDVPTLKNRLSELSIRKKTYRRFLSRGG